MGLSLTDTQLQEITRGLFLLSDPSVDTELPKPERTTGANDLGPKLAPVAADIKVQHLGIGVVDFSTSPPKVWLLNPDEPWRIASTAKLGMMLAAVQLRDDVRWVQQTKILTKPEDYDELFAMREVWGRAADMRVEEMEDPAHAPRPSTIFDFEKARQNNVPVDFFGSNPDAPDGTAITNRLAALRQMPPTSDSLALTWPHVTKFDFSELLWLAAARSDNVAATACISEIGVAYIKAVQRKYGLLSDRVKGMQFFLSGGYGAVDTKRRVKSGTAKYRALQDVEPQYVNDLFRNTSGKYDHLSWLSGTATSLTAYMIALMQDTFVAAGHFSGGQQACTTIRRNLAQGRPFETKSNIVEGVKTIAQVNNYISKIGLLRHKDGEFYQSLNCEFAYLETEEKSGDKRPMKYGVVATGIRSVTPGINAGILAQYLGAVIHMNLLR